MSELVAVVMAGGSGTRFWPLSTASMPKQFITAFQERSLYQQTLARTRDLIPPDRTLVISNERFQGVIEAQSPELPARNVILEPRRRDTAAAIALSAVIAQRLCPDCVMVVEPSDHHITKTDQFHRTLRTAIARAEEGGLVTLGIPPTYPATCYGYLHLEGSVDPGDFGSRALALREFVEKPDEDRARAFLDSGEFLWNSGLFVWRVETILEAIREFLPSTLETLEPVADAFGTPGFQETLRVAFDRIDNPTSIDFGVMEKAREVWAVPASFDWSDVGGWLAAKDFVDVGADGNRVRGDALAIDSRNSLVVAEGGHRLLCVGVDGFVVVATPAGTLVCREDLVETIKPHVEHLTKT